MEQLTLQPIRSVGGQIQLPGSKSLSNRVLLLSALAQGDTEVSNLLDSDDTRHMIAALRSLGASLQLFSSGIGRPLPGRTGRPVSGRLRNRHSVAVLRSMPGSRSVHFNR